MRRKWIIGIDEVGRGALAGPVVVAAVALPLESRIKNKELRKIRDSKQLTAKQREDWFKKIIDLKIPYRIARVNHGVIDKINITRAANLAAWRAFCRLTVGLPKKDCSVFLDGGLYLKYRGWAEENGVRSETIIKGDEKISAISAASIMAKVTRDRYMFKISGEYPGYNFNLNMGYGTKVHMDAIKKFGPSKIHRKTFIN